jgi:nucleoside-diphosphate-sugar epimerase
MQIRDYLHVQDVADGLVAALDSAVTGAVNVSSGQATTLREIVLTIGRQIGRPELIQLGAIPARANDVALVIGENTRLVTEVGWKQHYDLEFGIRQTIDWWRSRD